jgi:gluconolactonase
MPEKDYDVMDERFEDIVHANSRRQQLATDMGFTEGPVWLPSESALLFTDIPNNSIMRWHDGDGLSVDNDNSHFAIGLYLDLQERVIACEHTTRRLTRYDADGVTALATMHGEHILNSTNDVVVRASDGAVFFTDPPFGIRIEDGEIHGYQAAMEYGGCYVFKVTDDPTAPLVVTDQIYRPNGLCFSQDEKTLFVSDSSQQYHQIYRLQMQNDDTATNPEVFAVMPNGVPDGMRLDTQDRLFVAGGDGVYVWDKDGTLLGKIHVPEMVTNICFGGADRQTLFITATTSLYAIDLAATGAQKP